MQIIIQDMDKSWTQTEKLWTGWTDRQTKSMQLYNARYITDLSISVMSKKVRNPVPFIGVLLIIVTFPAFKLSSLEELQLWPTDHLHLCSVNSVSIQQEVSHFIYGGQCTVQSCTVVHEWRMAGLSTEQNFRVVVQIWQKNRASRDKYSVCDTII